MKTLLYFKNRIQTAVNPINVGLTAVFIFLTVKDGIITYTSLFQHPKKYDFTRICLDF